MPFNGSGTASQPSNTAAVSSHTISSSSFNTLVADLYACLTKMICKDGQSTPTADIPMGNFTLTGLGNPEALTDSATLGTVRTGTYAATVGGTANAITLTPTLAIPSYAAGYRFSFLPAANNTGATTVAVSGLAAKDLYSQGQVLRGGELVAGVPCEIEFDGTVFQVLSPGQSSALWTPVLTFATAGDLSVAYSTQVGQYARVGNLVLAWFYLVTSTFTFTTASGNARLTGLPFRAATTSLLGFFGGGSYWRGITKANFTDIVPYAVSGQTYLQFGISGSGQTATTVATGDMPSAGTVNLGGIVVYLTDGG